MAKIKHIYICSHCGVKHAQWLGKCTSCGEFNSIHEELVVPKSNRKEAYTRETGTATKIQNVQESDNLRFQLPDKELNRVLGGGLVAGSVTLLAGEPGIGKSTLLLQCALQWDEKALYISGEESESQIKMRAKRIGIKNENCYVLTETSLENIIHQFNEVNPKWLIIDSIQTLQTSVLESAPGTVSQVRECTSGLIKLAKETGVPIFLVGHITKDGAIAGPKVLEHMVDAVLHFEGDRHHTYRMIRGVKNRFGSANELGIYEMQNSGLREVTNPSEILISQKDDNLGGIAICASMEGMRPLLIEVQSLVSTAVYGTPQRNGTGFDMRRLNMLLAVLEKRCGFRLGAHDVFINIAGGIRIEDPALDLAIVAAILSSYQTYALPSKIAFAAEVGLSGEIRAVSRIEQRISEAQKLGFTEIVVSKFNKFSNTGIKGIKVVKLAKIEEVFEYLFG
jgi:DNA repair protein RadA/Sms